MQPDLYIAGMVKIEADQVRRGCNEQDVDCC